MPPPPTGRVGRQSPTGRGLRVIKQQKNHVIHSETLQSDRYHCQQNYSVQEEVDMCEEGGRSCEEENLWKSPTVA